MAVKTKDNQVKLNKIIFQARYRDGIKMLDRLGTLVSGIRKRDPEYALSSLNPGGAANLRKTKKRFVSSIGTEYIDLQYSQSTPVKESTAIVEDLARDAEWLFEATLSVLDMPETTRIGIYFEFVAPSDSLEESDRFAVKALNSPFFNWAKDSTNSDPTDAQATYVFRDSETGVCTGLTILSIVLEQPAGTLPPMGFPVEGSGGLGIGIDSYLQPDNGQFAKTMSFINTQFERAKRIAFELFSKIVSSKN